MAGLNQISNIGDGGFARTYGTNTLLEATLNYDKDFGNSQLNVVGGYSYQKFDRNGFFTSGRGFATNNLNNIANQLAGNL